MKIKPLLLILLIGTIYIQNLQSSDILRTHFNQQYATKLRRLNKPEQETPWGFQEILLSNSVETTVKTINEYQKLISKNTKNGQWKDNKVHIINFKKGLYLLPKLNRYYIMLVPSKTIIKGAGEGKTIFKASIEIDKNDTFHFRKVFNLEYATHDVVLKNFSFYNETKDNKWGLIHSNGNFNRENYLFENIEFDDTFGTIGKQGYQSNFITFRGIKKRVGMTSKKIKNNFQTPIPITYQFYNLNKNNIELAGQIAIREGNSIIFHDCILGDTISASIDIYSNYIEIVGVKFINPLLDHSIKAPNANHLYIHHSSFLLNYKEKIIDNSYWNPTFYTHEGGDALTNYHFKKLHFKRTGSIINRTREGNITYFIESEPLMIYDNRTNNHAGDMVWENITFDGYTKRHRIVGYPNVQTKLGYEAINYTSHKALAAQMRLDNNNSRGYYHINIQQKKGSSQADRKGVYSWGKNDSTTIDYPRDNQYFKGKKKMSFHQKYIEMKYSTIKTLYNTKIIQ